MYVRQWTTQEQIKNEISRIEFELNHNKFLSGADRAVLHDELDYLYSFVIKEEF